MDRSNRQFCLIVFYRALICLFLQALPKEFTKNIRGQIQEVVKLEVPDGKTYDIQIANEHNGLVFRSGWAKFASAYELEQCDKLVFRYSGNSHFKVQIFDPSGCEKEFSCVMMESKPSVKGRLVQKKH